MVTYQETKDFLYAHNVLKLNRTEASVYAGITPGQVKTIIRNEHLLVKPLTSSLASLSASEILELEKHYTATEIARMHNTKNKTVNDWIKRAKLEQRSVPTYLDEIANTPIEELEARLLGERR